MEQRKINLLTALFLSFGIIYAFSLYMQAGLLPVGVIFGSMMGGLMGWRKTTAHHPADPIKVVPLYLLLLVLFNIHVGEEYLTHFNQAIASISGHNWEDKNFTFFIALMGPIIWIYGAFSLWLKRPFGNFILWFMIVGMILGEPTHFLVFPLVKIYQQGGRYEYFSGMYTALFPMVPAILAMLVIFVDSKKFKAQNKKSMV